MWTSLPTITENSQKVLEREVRNLRIMICNFPKSWKRYDSARTHRQFSIAVPEVLQRNIENHYRCNSSDYSKLQYSEMYWKDPIPQLVSRKNTIEERQTSKLCCFFKYSSRNSTEKNNRISYPRIFHTALNEVSPLLNFAGNPLWRTRTQKFVEKKYMVFLTLAW